MKNCITLILLGISVFCSAQTEKKAEKKDINGIILFRFIPDTKMKDSYCSLKPRILINSKSYDFIPESDANYSIIKRNMQFEKELGDADSFLTKDIVTIICVFRSKDKRFESYNCDSVINVFRKNNIYDTLLYKEDMEELMKLRIKSDAIYTKEHSDTIYIALQFNGNIIKYDNIVWGEQSDYRIISLDDGTEEFDNSHSLCPFEEYNSTIIVLNKVNRLDRIDKDKQIQMGLIKSELTQLKIFLYE